MPVEEQRPRRSLPLVLAAVASALVLGAALVAPLVDQAIRGEERAQRALDLTLVETWEITDRAHTTDDVTYPQDPPAGGAHAPIWLACGVYDEPVRDENAVHDLEHGTVWITHDPDLSDDDRATLAEQLPDNGIMSPREGLPVARRGDGLGCAAQARQRRRPSARTLPGGVRRRAHGPGVRGQLRGRDAVPGRFASGAGHRRLIGPSSAPGPRRRAAVSAPGSPAAPG